MSHVGAPRGRTCSRTLRSVALLTSGVLALPALSACSSDDGSDSASAAAPDIAPAGRDWVRQGGTLRWAIDSVPTTLNVFQADADGATSRVAGAVLPALFTLDKSGRPQRNPDYLESAKVVEREPKQVVLYKLNQQAVWSDGREIGAADFASQWRALRGKDSAYWTARNAGYERIQKIERGANNLEVRVTFNKPYADWKSLFSPLYPKDVTGKPNSFNDKARTALKTTAGPFRVKKVDRKEKKVTLTRNPRWWGEPAKLNSIVLSAVPRAKRAAALADGKLDLAEIDRRTAERISLADRDNGSGGQPLTHGPGTEITAASALRSWALAHGSDDEKAEEAQDARKQTERAIATYAREQKALRGYEVRKSLEPAYTQLALNGESGPLADERVRRAVARALDRQELADTVLKPLGLPARTLGSHLALIGQQAYADSSKALGKQDTQEAQALLADAGWVPGGGRKKAAGTKAGSEAKKGEKSGGAEGNEGSENAEEESSETKPSKEPMSEKQQEAEEKKADERAAAEKKKWEEHEKKEEKKAAEKKSDEKKPDEKKKPAEKAPADDEKKAEDEKSASAKSEGSSAGEAPSDEGEYIVGDSKPGRSEPRRPEPRQAEPLQTDSPQTHSPQAETRQADPLQAEPRQAAPNPESATHILAPALATTAAFHGATLLRQAASVGDTHSGSGTGSRTVRVAHASHEKPGGMAGAYAPRGTAAPAPRTGPLGKNGKRLTLRFVLPSGEGSESLRTVGERISRMLDRIGIGTEITKVDDASYFKDHIASGEYDLALYSWPATAYPATDGRPIFAKPVPASDGSLLVEQNYTRVGTYHIDQLFDRAASELNEGTARDLVRQADARIWAAAGSIPLYQRPELAAAKPGLMNAGAFGFATPRYQDMGYKNAGDSGPDAKKK
ncbi:ABC transporter substrate-binding protein [Streptomyces sp. NPDC088116]|uniref:ABC transporter substrate-binding protein n=1 Tax=Streptomyces sp. NPDC088116 TaxID=3365825 RepID=UPI003828F1EB